MSEKVMIEKMNKLYGVTTKQLNMFNLHELYVDGVHVAYVRATNGEVEVLPVLKFTANPGKMIHINNMKRFEEMIERYKVKNYIGR